MANHNFKGKQAGSGMHQLGNWTKRFLEALAEATSVAAAIRAAGVSADTVYKKRRNDPKFSAAWDEALERRLDNIEAALMDRAEGWREPIYNKSGQVIGHRKKGDTVAAIFMLKANRPEKYREVITEQSVNVAPTIVVELPAKKADEILEIEAKPLPELSNDNDEA